MIKNLCDKQNGVSPTQALLGVRPTNTASVCVPRPPVVFGSVLSSTELSANHCGYPGYPRARSTAKGQSPPKSRSPSPKGRSKTVGKWTVEERLALRATQAMRRQLTQSAPAADDNRLYSSPFWKLRTEILGHKGKGADQLTGGPRSVTVDFQRKMKILDDRTAEMKKALAPTRKPHQALPEIKTLAERPDPKVLMSVPHKLVRRTASPQIEELLAKPLIKKDPNFVEFSSLSSSVWLDIATLESGETIPIIMKTMRPQQWEKLIKYYGVFERAGRLDRAILFEFAQDLGEKYLDHPTYKDLLKSLDPDPNEALFLMGKLIMSVYHVIVVGSGQNAKNLSISQIVGKLDSGYKTIMKTKREGDVRANIRAHLKTKHSASYRP